MSSNTSPFTAFRARLRQGPPPIGVAVSMTDPMVSEALADSVDFLWIDLEHNALSRQALQNHLLAGRGKSVPVVVRVPDSTAPTLKPLLDSGVEGVVVPQVRSIAEVESLVENCMYPPAGKRGMGPRIPSRYGRRGGPAYVQQANDELFLSVMIETAEALEAIDTIVQIKRLDSVVIGPYDLSGSLGILGDVEHPMMVKAYKRIIATAVEAGIFVGCGAPADVACGRSMIDLGVQWLQLGSDFELMIQRMDELRKQVKRAS